ncbi:hypothetical protein [Candidatus Formimonas warabiya]|uniref:Uncharacterized protein n=1 Tax=Formimonas warabiya TaxID=1761012 RepID=A0A3G1KMV5_FORW1|nr:hypothetical protein [Candidatus Formimonas warabiya]ATW23435.1 hypothetical protein DCMF_00265 [Candidatus Formimonas warabiya]
MKLKLRYILFYIFILTLAAMGISFSRFSTTLTNSGAENTTPPDIEFSTWVLDYHAASVSLDNMFPGDTRTIAIWVRNWQAGDPVKISGYTQNYNLELETTGNLPLEYTLADDEGKEVNLSRPDSFRYIGETQQLSADMPETKEYLLSISWPVEKKDFRYRNEIDYLELKIRAVQAEGI